MMYLSDLKTFGFKRTGLDLEGRRRGKKVSYSENATKPSSGCVVAILCDLQTSRCRGPPCCRSWLFFASGVQFQCKILEYDFVVKYNECCG